jgi:hypothetical protein
MKDFSYFSGERYLIKPPNDPAQKAKVKNAKPQPKQPWKAKRNK